MKGATCWHHNSIAALKTAKQSLLALDGLTEMVELKQEGPLQETARELVERAVLFMEEILEVGGYFEAVKQGFFVDSGYYPSATVTASRATLQAGLARHGRAEGRGLFCAVCAHFGYNQVRPSWSHLARPSAVAPSVIARKSSISTSSILKITSTGAWKRRPRCGSVCCCRKWSGPAMGSSVSRCSSPRPSHRAGSSAAAGRAAGAD